MIPIDSSLARRNKAAFPWMIEIRTTDGAVVANTIIKLSATPGRVVQFLTVDDVSLASGVALDAATGAGQDIRVVEVEGVESQIKSDGTTTINPGDIVQTSATVDGRVMKGTQRAIGAATTGAAATLDALVSVL